MRGFGRMERSARIRFGDAVLRWDLKKIQSGGNRRTPNKPKAPTRRSEDFTDRALEFRPYRKQEEDRRPPDLGVGHGPGKRGTR